jgi:hypothetical protein
MAEQQQQQQQQQGNPNFANPETPGYVGFANLPNQVRMCPQVGGNSLILGLDEID